METVTFLEEQTRQSNHFNECYVLFDGARQGCFMWWIGENRLEIRKLRFLRTKTFKRTIQVILTKTTIEIDFLRSEIDRYEEEVILKLGGKIKNVKGEGHCVIEAR